LEKKVEWVGRWTGLFDSRNCGDSDIKKVLTERAEREQ